MKKLNSNLFITGILILLIFPNVSAQETDHKFIRTFAIRIGGSSLEPGDEVLLAKFELVNFNRFHYNDINGDTWGTIRAINPNVELYLYQAGRSTRDIDDHKPIVYLNNLGRWNISRGHSMGSLNIDNPELFLLDSDSNRIYSPSYPDSWLMDVGSKAYQDYWIEATIHDIVDQPWTVDGVFVDNVQSRLTGMSSMPVKYATDEEWDSAMHDFIDAITVGLHNKSQKIWGNRGHMRNEHDYDSYVNLDNLPDPPDAMLVEGIFACKWGSEDVQFYPEGEWKLSVDLPSEIHNYKLCYQSHTDLSEGQNGTDNHGKPVNFWDVLWYAMASYHIGKNEVDNNSYFGFSESYNKVIWYDEFDHIDLGKAVGNYKVTNYNGNDIYWREFEEGYVYVNPTKNDVSSISLTETCKQLTHDNFKNDSATIPDVNTITLKSHRGTMLLKSEYQPPETIDPTALYHFDEGSGTIAFDSSGNGNDGTINGATWTNDSISGNALEFDGVDDYIDLGSPESLDFGTGDFTITVWINNKIFGTDPGESQHIIGRGWGDQSTHKGYSLDFTWNSYWHDRLRFAIADGTNKSVSMKNAKEHFDDYKGQWLFLAAKREGDTIYVYINGTEWDSSDASDVGNISVSGSFNDVVYIGDSQKRY
jgi:hypothetical protein